MTRPIIFWGAKGHAKVLRDFIGILGYRLICTFDNDCSIPAPFADVPLICGLDGFEKWIQNNPGVSCVVAIGGWRGQDRCALQASMKRFGATPVTVVHPTASVASTARLGPGCQVLAQSIVSVDTQLGAACIANHKSSIDHECMLGDGVHVAPGATVAGCVSIGDFSFIGAGAVILPRLNIGRNVIVGAGAVVTKDLPDDIVAYGNPARVIRSNN